MCQEIWSATSRGLASVERSQLGGPGWPRSGPKASGGSGQDGRKPLGVKDGFVSEHKEGSPRQFDGDDGVGFELVAAHAGLQLLGQGFEPVVIAL